MSGHWGKAGVRLTSQEVDERRRRRAAERNRAALRTAAADRIAYEKWRHGLVVPARITWALDAQDLYGPDVDAACGGEEPDVDLWEAGVRYPTWEQLLALARLTGYMTAYFCEPVGAIHFVATSLRFHTRGGWTPERPVVSFTREAVAATVGGAS